MKLLTEKQNQLLNEAAYSVGVSPQILYKMIAFESSWNPNAKNPKSSARGLLQWIDSTAVRMGFSSSQALVNRNPTIESQLKLIPAYLKMYAPYSSDYEFVLSNFLPAYRKYSPHTPILSLPNGAKYQKANPRIKELNDYYKMVMKMKIPSTISGKTIFPLLPVAVAVAVVGFFLFLKISS